MAFGWVIRHQKKALFVLAVVLIVGWGLSGMIQKLFSARRENRATDPRGSIAGEVVTGLEFQNFKVGWTKVFPDILGRNAVEGQYSGDNITTDEIAWAYLGLAKMATEAGIRVSDENVVASKRVLFQMQNGRDAQFGDNAQTRQWLHEKLGMSGEMLDEIVRQRLMAENMMGQIVQSLEPTEGEAWEAFSRENRGVRVKYVTFPSSDFVGKTAEPSQDQIEAYYDAERGFGGQYFTSPTVQIEYVRIIRAKVEAECRLTVEEMKKYYDDHMDLYRTSEPKGLAPESEYLGFPEVKPEIEATLRRQEADAKATMILADLGNACKGTPGEALETLVKGNKAGVLEYFRTPFLTEAELLTLPGISTAQGGAGKGIAEIASEMNPKEPRVSGVMSGPDGWFVLRVVAGRSEGNAPPLSEVKAKVVLDMKKASALGLAQKAAIDSARELRKPGGAAKFEEWAASHKLAVKETTFFVNTAVDVNRPPFVDGSCALEMGEVYGPLVSVREGVVGVVKVTAERPADPLGFAGERETKRSETWNAKAREFRRVLFPRTLLKFAGYKDLRVQSEKPATEATDY